MSSQKPKKHETRKAWHILLSHFKDYRPSIILLAVLGVISALANGTVPYIVGLFLDAILDLEREVSFFGMTLAAWFGILLLWVFVQLAANFVDWIIDRRGRVLRMTMQLGYQAKAFIHLLYVPLSFHKDEKIGQVSEHLMQTSWQIASIAESILVRLSPPILSVVVGFTVTFIINPIFTAVLVLGIIVYLIVLFKLLVPTTNLLEEGHTAWNDAYADAFQAVSNVQSVKHMTTEAYETKKIEKGLSVKTLGIWNHLHYVWSGINFYQRIIVLVTQAIIFFLSVYFIQQGSLTIGELVALNGYAGLLFGPFVMFGNIWQTLQNGLVKVQQAEEKIFQRKSEEYHPKDAYTPKSIKGAVEFRDTSFSYDGTTPVLKGISFKVEPGERIAFVGKSGVGKSTTIDLISGYYFPTKGSVLVDGHDTRKFDLTAFRSEIAIVPQEPVLFNDTIFMNIRYGRLGATETQVIEAAKRAHAHEFIMELPKQYKQLVGERGVKLSVGQKQRIAIARAILRDPSILVLDEPTSALDAETEKHIAESFETLMEGRTTFIVAHRLSTVRKANRIMVFEKGKIVEEGTHETLIQRQNGVYRRLYEYQTGLTE